jgi:Na+-driven multidrug efflux pump
MNKNGKIINTLFRRSVVSIIAAAVAAMLGIVIDGIIIGRFLGPDSMAAYGLVTPVVNMATIFSGVLATGAQVVCAQHLGAGDVKRARRAFSMCMVITAVISVVLVTLIVVFRGDIAVFLGARGKSAHLLPYASDYILGMVFSLPSVILLFEFNALMRLDGDANRVVIAVVVMTVLDVTGDVLNALVIHGGMLGMGLATTISYAVALGIMLLHFTKKDIIFKFSFKGLKLRDIRDILVTGSSSAVGSASTMLRNIVLNRILVMTALSGTAVAALGILNTVLNFTTSVMIGVGLTAAMIAGMILGEQDRSSAEYLVKVTVQTAIVIGAGLGVIVFLAADVIAAAFGGEDGAGMVALAARGLRIYSVSIVLYGINNAFVNYTQGMRRMGFSTFYCFLQNFVFIVIPALALSGILEVDAVWFAFVIGEVLTLLAIIVLAGILKKGVPFRAKDFLFLKEPFGAPEDEVFEVSIAGRSEVIPASKAVEGFCHSKGATAKENCLLPLFVEELGNNIAEFGIGGDKHRSLDIRVVRMEDGWILRLRDNCKAFNPTEWISLHEKDDPTANIGIRMVCGMAKSVNYLNTMDLNIITLRI